jgi:cell division cycle 14
MQDTPQKLSPVHERLYIAQNINKFKLQHLFRCFHLEKEIQYEPYCDDFGPMDMSCVAHFIKSLDKTFTAFPDLKIVFCVEPGRRNLTNAVFLLGAYMVLKDRMNPKEVAERFASLDSGMMEYFRDATYSKPDFDLCLLDCWRSLHMGRVHGWVRVSPAAELCGKIYIDQYRHYIDPAKGDLNEVVPGKFIAFKGPVELGQRAFQDRSNRVRLFSPSFYVDVFRDMGVSTVLRLNEPRYDAKAFTSQGFEHFDLEFEDCTCPPDHVVAAFFRIVDAAPGLVAVHCHAGLGRTGTLIGLYLMRSRGFTAREAIGWLRIMRPGSVIGEQQHYLCTAERGVWRESSPSDSDAGRRRGDEAAKDAEAVWAGVERQRARRPSHQKEEI